MSKNKADKKIVKIKYKNWKGKAAIRTIKPIKIWYGSTQWHSEEQWLLKAKDIDKEAERDFALKDIVKWLG